MAAGLLEFGGQSSGGLLGDLINDPGARMGLLMMSQASPKLRGLADVIAQQDQAAQMKMENDWRQKQIARQEQEWGRADQINALAPQYFGQGKSDLQGYANALMALDPKQGLSIQSALAKELPVDKIDPKAFTPESLARFAQSRNYGDLVPRDKMEVSEGVVFNPYDSGMAGRTLPNPNKPFQLGADGAIVPNKAYQQYELSKAAAGAARTSNNISVNTEKSLLNTIAGGMGSQIDASLAQARGASDQLRTIGQLSDILNSGKVMAGPATKPAMLLTQLGAQLGLAGKDANETLAKTRDAMQKMAQLELDAAAQMKGQGQITESERDIIRRAASGDITMTLPELKTLTRSLDKTARYRIERHNQNIQPLLQNPNAAPLAPFLTVQPPPQTQQSQGGAPSDIADLLNKYGGR